MMKKITLLLSLFSIISFAQIKVISFGNLKFDLDKNYKYYSINSNQKKDMEKEARDENFKLPLNSFYYKGDLRSDYVMIGYWTETLKEEVDNNVFSVYPSSKELLFDELKTSPLGKYYKDPKFIIINSLNVFTYHLEENQTSSNTYIIYDGNYIHRIVIKNRNSKMWNDEREKIVNSIEKK